MNKDLTYTIALVGPSSVGKTSICNRYFYDTFSSTEEPTVAIDPFVKTIKNGIGKLVLYVVDTSGDAKFDSVVSPHINLAKTLLLVCSLDDPESIINIKNWGNMLDANKTCILVINKCDMVSTHNRELPTTLLEFYSKHCSHYFVTSAETGKGINALFETVIDDAYDKIEVEIENAKVQTVLEPLLEKPVLREKKCCWCW